MAKLRTRKHKVVLSRSGGGDFGINLFLVLMGGVYVPADVLCDLSVTQAA